MTVTAQSARKIISGSGWSNPLSWADVTLENSAHLEVWTDDTQLALGDDYSITGVGDSEGFSVTIVDTGLAPDVFVLVLKPTMTQGADLSNGGRFGVAAEEALDALARRMQALEDMINRAVKVPLTTALDADQITIEAVAEGHLWKADANGNMVDAGDGDDIAGAQTAAATATAKAAEALQSAADALQSAEDAAASAAEATGDVTGPASAVDSQLAVFSGTSGKTLKVGADTEKSTPIDADRLPLIDSAATNAVKWLSLTNLWTWIKAKADTFYQALDAQLSSLIRQNSQSAAYTLVLTDGGKHIFHPSADTTARIWTIPANASVAYPIGTAITFINQNGAGVITIAITSDTMRLAGAGTTGSRTLAANGVATAVKVTSTEWIISGMGLT